MRVERALPVMDATPALREVLREWRTPLRNALDWVRDTVAPRWEEKAREFLKEPWAARDAYVDIVHVRSAANLQSFFSRQARRRLTGDETTTALKLLELQRHALLMYTSCGWFFDELSGIETVQILQYAGRAVQLAQELFGDSLEANFIKLLASAKSNLPEQGDGSSIYERYVKTAKVDWETLGAHYAVSTFFENFPKEKKIYCYDSTREDHQVFTAGRARLGLGRVKLTSNVTLDSKTLSFGVLHLGDHNINGGVAEFVDDDTYQKMLRDAVQPFARADFAGVIRVMDRCFGESNYSVQSLFRDQQRTFVQSILAANLIEAETLYRQIYEQRAPLMRFLTALQIPLPKAFSAAAELVVNGHLRAAFEQERIDPTRINHLIETAKVEGLALDTVTLEFVFRKSLERLAERFSADPTASNLEPLDTAASLLKSLPFTVNLWQVQNTYYGLLKSIYPNTSKPKAPSDPIARDWLSCFEDLGAKLGIKLP